MWGMETKWQRLGDIARGTETVWWGLEVILQIWRLGGHFCRNYGASAPLPRCSCKEIWQKKTRLFTTWKSLLTSSIRRFIELYKFILIISCWSMPNALSFSSVQFFLGIYDNYSLAVWAFCFAYILCNFCAFLSHFFSHRIWTFFSVFVWK